MKKIYTILASLAIAGAANAQIKVYDAANPPAEQTEVYNPEQGSSFNQDVKVNFGGMLNGVVMLNYERMINDKISLEGGLGITMQDYYERFTSGLSSNSEDQEFEYGTGLAFEASFRYFFMDIDEMSGFYGQATYRYRKYDLKESNNIGRTYNDKIIAFGQQWAGDNGFVLDYSIGFNLYSIKYPAADYSQSYSVSNYNTVPTLVEKTDSGIQLYYALKLGYAF